MCLTCTCIVARLRPCWLTKTRSRTQIVGTRIPHAERRFAQILAQWTWNIRLELGQQLSGAQLCITEFAPALEAEPVAKEEPAPEDSPYPSVIYGPPQWARPSFTHGFPGSAFTPQPDGTLHCPANHPLYPQERRPERDGSLRILYAARIGHCRSCPLRAQCQESSSALKPRRVSAVLWPLSSSPSASSPPPDPLPAHSPSAPVRLRATGHAVASDKPGSKWSAAKRSVWK